MAFYKFKLSMYFLILLLQLLNADVFQRAVKESLFHQIQEQHTFNLVFENANISPDGFLQKGIVVNGQFPGPTLRVNSGSFLRVIVRNKLPHGFAIHFHGIFQKGTVGSDGVPGITQYEIPPNGTYTYEMEIGSQSGTFMYHAHTGLDQNWAMGALIVDNSVEFNSNSTKRYQYDFDEVFILSQCWHVPITEIASGVLGNPFQDVPDTDSILINGRSHGNWSGNMKNDNSGYSVIKVKSGKTYRFRVISLAIDTMLTFAIDNHIRFRVIEMDSILTQPVETDHLEINAAQRYSILVTMDQPIGNYWIRSEMIPGPGPGNGRAILHYEGAADPGKMKTEIFPLLTDTLELTEWITPLLYPAKNIKQLELYPVPVTVDKEFVIKSQQVNNGGRTQFNINGQIFQNFHPPILHQLRGGVEYAGLHKEQKTHLYEILIGQSIQIVFVNSMSDDGECEQHPWHMHGHAFHVVGQGSGDYDPHTAKAIIDENIVKNRHQFRDVVTLYPSQSFVSNETGTPCGWVAIRFLANNPGVWMVHCHLTAHMLMGKLFVLYEHTPDDLYFNEIS